MPVKRSGSWPVSAVPSGLTVCFWFNTWAGTSGPGDLRWPLLPSQAALTQHDAAELLVPWLSGSSVPARHSAPQPARFPGQHLSQFQLPPDADMARTEIWPPC